MKLTFSRLLVLMTALYAGSAQAEGAKSTAAEIQARVRKMLNASGPAIDQCTERYLSEYPKAEGKVELSATVIKDGSVSRAKADTALAGARNLRYCLEKVAKGWRFPPLNTETETMALTVEVRKGLQFKILAPGEKPKARGGKRPSGFLRLMPTGWNLGSGTVN